MKLHTYFRSSAAYRVRIALHYKQLAFESCPVNLREREQVQFEFKQLNPQGLVPVLEDGGVILSQSLAICEYLEEQYPDPPILPRDAVGRARVRALASLVACDIHPLNNLRVLDYLGDFLHVAEGDRRAWYRHWVGLGLVAMERRLSDEEATGRCCHGDEPTLADICLVPQVYNAERFDCDLSPYPYVRRIVETCRSLPAFQAAHPAIQPDAA